MREMTPDEVRQVQLEIMDELDAFCRNNQLIYFLEGGTLLGAIRHKGYIPWDDDVDISMPREDYEKFLKTFKKEGLSLKTPYNDKTYYYPFAKLCDDRTVIHERADIDTGLSVYIDIFPVDTIRKENIKPYHRRQKILLYILSSQTALMDHERPLYRQAALVILRKLFAHIDLSKVAAEIDLAVQKYSDPCGQMAGALPWRYEDRMIVDRAILAEFEPAEFEGRQYMIPKKYDEYLRAIYGDYMQLPPEEERISHGIEAYWK